MNLETAKAILLPIHAAVGLAALCLGFMALRARKERGRHTRLGGAFVALMLVAIAVSVPVMVLSRNVFLGGLGMVALYLTVMGWRIGKLRPPQGVATRLDQAFIALSLALFSGFVAFGLWVVSRGQVLGLAASGIGYLGAHSAWSHSRFLADPEGAEGSWMTHHGGALGGAFIASTTAFFAAVLTSVFPSSPRSWSGSRP